MKRPFFKAYSFLFYILAFVTSFFIGLSYASYIEAGKGQMLAGGAIVLGYGVIAAFMGFLISIFVVYKANRKLIVRLNIVLAISIAAFYLYYHLKYLEKQKEKEEQKFEQPKPTTPAGDAIDYDETAMLIGFEIEDSHIENGKFQESQMGLGMFTPNFYENPVLYFYGNPNLEKNVQEHTPTDSITFNRRESGGFVIASAPPWLVPDHLKLDYDLLYFKVQTLTHDFLEVTVNTTTNQTAYVDKYSGKLQYWPEFLLNVNSVEFHNPEEKIYVKPLNHAGTVSTTYSFMKPLQIRNEWMHVALLNDDFRTVGKGWVRWRKNGRLLITYSLLS